MANRTTQDDQATEKPLKVLIVGAGLAGLAVAISLRRQGHHVEIFEASRFANDVGAGITIPPNAARALKGLGVDVHLMRGVEWQGTSLCLHDGTMKKNVTNPPAPGEFPYALLVHRVDYHNVLKDAALSEEGAGETVKLHLQNSVQTCDPEQGIITLQNGETHQGDVIVGTDGIRSTVRTSVLGKVHIVPASHMASFRWLADSSKFKDDPELSWVAGEGPQGPRYIFESVRGQSTILTYPCRNGELYNVTTPFVDERDQDAVEWTVPTTLDYILEKLSDYDPKFIKYLKLADNPKIWQIRSLGTLPTWINGRVCLAGDAAHSMMPTIGQGASQAMEDAVTLGVLLPRGTKRESVPRRLELYQQARKEHVEYVQSFSLEHMFPNGKGYDAVKIRKVSDEIAQYDALKRAQEVLDEESKRF